MRRLAVATAFAGAGVLAARALVPRLHPRMMAACERMFEQMPESFPPKRMMLGVEEVRTNTARILELLEGHEEMQEAVPPLPSTPTTRKDAVDVVVA